MVTKLKLDAINSFFFFFFFFTKITQTARNDPNFIQIYFKLSYNKVFCIYKLLIEYKSTQTVNLGHISYLISNGKHSAVVVPHDIWSHRMIFPNSVKIYKQSYY